jgi:hypothetical protein
MRTLLPIVFALFVQHKATPPKDAPPKPQEIIFGEGDWVSVTPVKPDSDVVEVTKRPRVGNLLVVRKHFLRELYKSAENVK